MAYDYRSLLQSEDGIADTWRELYDDDLLLSENLLNILKQTVLLPHDHYDIIAAYYLLPSALCKLVPYLFLYGQSGSGKSTVAKIASYVHGVPINSSSDTFAGIRNSLEERRRGYADVVDPDDPTRTWREPVAKNTCMVWDDINAQTFTSQPQLYNMFKFGCDTTTDKITISSGEAGQNIEFRCFCPKIFSSISPLHLDDSFRELKRRLIVIPCKRVEELSDTRKAELGITDDNWQGKLLDPSAYDWKGFSQVFSQFWDLENAQSFLTIRRILAKSVRGLSSQQRGMSLDIMAAGIASSLWQDEAEATERMKVYWQWFKTETEKNAGLGTLLKNYIDQEAENARNGGRALEIYTSQLRSQIKNWVDMGWLYEKPQSKKIKELMLDLGMRLQHGKWRKD